MKETKRTKEERRVATGMTADGQIDPTLPAGITVPFKAEEVHPIKMQLNACQG